MFDSSLMTEIRLLNYGGPWDCHAFKLQVVTFNMLSRHVYNCEDVVVKDTLNTHNVVMYLIKIFGMFGIKHRVYKSRSTKSIYIWIWIDSQHDGLKIRISDHSKR